MAKAPKIVPIPTREQVIEFIKASPGRVGKREIARAFRLTGSEKDLLKDMLREIEAEGEVNRAHGRRYGGHAALPEVMALTISGTDAEGELLARPQQWDQDGVPPRILMAPAKRGEPALGIGDHCLARLRRLREGLYEAQLVRRLTAGPARVLGVFEIGEDGRGWLRPTDRRQKADFLVAPFDRGEAEPGELVLAEILPGKPYGPKPARITERLGSMANPRAVSLIAINTHGIPDVFPPEVVAQADASAAAPLGSRTDLRAVPLVTIDGEDARDFDDAVWAQPDGDGGWQIIVAIADVAWYVRPGDALDREAFKRGNSVYFPDRVVPMLPEALSNGWCSLRPNEDRPCMAVHIWIDADGNKRKHQFVRAMMRSAARLTYEQVQQALDGTPDDTTGPLLEPVLKPLYGAWKALLAERQARGVLELDLPERKVVLDASGKIVAITPRPRYDSHRLIEDFMIAANVAAAEQIEAVKRPCMYRVHDLPSVEKLDGLREVLDSVGLSLPRGQVLRPAQFNQILEKAKELPDAAMINEMVLRSQAQAVYSPENLGHFGLGLARYAHFTSPIRRYADLLVHRALIAGLNLGEGALPHDADGRFAEAGEHISTTERRAAAAERDAIDRYTTLFLAEKVGASFTGRINGVTRFGLFVTLAETGADGLVPISTLPDDFYDHDERLQCLRGRRAGRVFSLGAVVQVILQEANPLTGALVFRLDAASAAGTGAIGQTRRPRSPGTDSTDSRPDNAAGAADNRSAGDVPLTAGKRALARLGIGKHKTGKAGAVSGRTGTAVSTDRSAKKAVKAAKADRAAKADKPAKPAKTAKAGKAGKAAKSNSKSRRGVEG